MPRNEQPQPRAGEIIQPQPRARKTDLVTREVSAEILVYDLKRHKAHCLNQTAALIWKYCDGQKTVAEIATLIEQEAQTPVDETTIWLAVEQLGKSHLLEDCELSSVSRIRLSRRELIRRLGQGATLALPLVTSIISPSAARAASCGPSNNTSKLNPVGCPCNTNPACANSCCGFGNICAATGSVLNGGDCRVNCECASGNCVDPAGPATGTCQP